MLKIGIVGYGFVGKAVDFGFQKKVQKIIIDPKLNSPLSILKDHNPEYIFVCVPTPMNSNGSQDSSILEEVLQEIDKDLRESIVIVKSTVLPNTVNKMKEKYNRFVYNPEFLREKTANEDFVNSDTLILGGEGSHLEKVEQLYKKHSDCKIKNVHKTDVVSASLVKYSINTFLATKVIFFNQLHDIYRSLVDNKNWDEFKNMISSDDRIGPSHMDVPGHDGKLGFGGACFPKDTTALLALSKIIDKEFTLLKEAIKVNNGIRMNYNDLDAREQEQGISFNLNLD